MEEKKCGSCGANLDFVRTRNLWVCPFCGSQYSNDSKAEDKEEDDGLGLSSALFMIEKDLKTGFMDPRLELELFIAGL